MLLVPLLLLLAIQQIHCNFPHPQPDVSLNTISSTPYPAISSGGYLLNQNLATNGKVWYLDSNSPFKVAPLKSCNICGANHNNGLASSGSANYNTIQQQQQQQQPLLLDMSHNPFLNGQVPIVPQQQIQTVQKVESTTSTTSKVDISNNPFLTGKVPVVVPPACASGTCSTGSSQTIQVSSKPTTTTGGLSNNPFLTTGYKNIPLPPKPLDTGYNFPGINIPLPPQQPKLPGFATSLPQQPITTQGFATSLPTNLAKQTQQFIQEQQQQYEQSQQQLEQSQLVQQQQQGLEQQQQQQQGFEQQNQQQQQQGFEQQNQQQQQQGFNVVVVSDKDDDELTIACSTTNHICVPKNDCVDGKIVNVNGQGIIQARTTIDYCKVNSEVCCEVSIIKQHVTREVFAQNPIFGPATSGSYSTNNLIHIEPLKQQGLLKQGPQYLPPYPTAVSPTPEPELIPPYSPDGSNSNSVTALFPTTSGYLPPTTITPKPSNNGYLPPLIGDGSNIDNQKVPLPSNGFGTFLPPPKPITDFDALPSGCPAALICVEEEFCSADGVASQSRVFLTEAQKESRVPITSCTIAGGKPGKCCRDPTYKDPWPVGQLGLWNPNDGFDDGSYKANGNANQGRISPPPQPRPQPQPQPQPQIDNDLAASGQCAIRDRNTRPRGNIPLDANFAEIPWQAMILRDTNRSLLCGGVIISDNAVLTAAHCVAGFPTNDILVKGGEWRLGVDEEPKPFQIVKVGAIVIHPRYNQQKQLNDLALLFLSEKFRFDQHIQPICILDDEEVERNYPNADCITSGWGKDVLKIHIQNALMHQMDINFIQKGDCLNQIQQKYPENLYRYESSSCLCAQPKVPEYTICDVDQGSALACDVGNGVYLLAGILSWDTESCTTSANEIAAFARLDTRWIYEFLAKPLQQIIAEYGGASTNIQPTFVKGGGGVKGGVKGGRIPVNQFGNFGSFSHNIPVVVQQPQHQHADGQPCNCASAN